MRPRLPLAALLLGLAGLLPFIGTALGALSGTDANAGRFLAALIAYAALILSFLGGVHWGFVLGVPAPEAYAARAARERYRLVLGVLPALVGWLALIVTTVLSLPEAGVAVLIAGFVALVAAEAELRRGNLMPAGYMWMRWGLSIVVVLILATVLTVRLLGGRIIF